MRPLPEPVRRAVADRVNAAARRLAEEMERTKRGSFEIRTVEATADEPAARVGTDDPAGFVEEWGTGDAPGSAWAARAAWGAF